MRRRAKSLGLFAPSGPALVHSRELAEPFRTNSAGLFNQSLVLLGLSYKSIVFILEKKHRVILRREIKKSRTFWEAQKSLRAKGYEVSDIGYFVYVDGQHKGIEGMLDEDPEKATMIFNTSLLTYNGDDSWVEQALIDSKACVLKTDCPEHAQTGFGPKGDKPCEYSSMFEGMKDNGLSI